MFVQSFHLFGLCRVKLSRCLEISRIFLSTVTVAFIFFDYRWYYIYARGERRGIILTCYNCIARLYFDIERDIEFV